MLLKAFLFAEFAALVGLIASGITNVEQGVVLAGAAVGSMVVIWRAIRAVARGTAKAAHAYSVLLAIDERLGGCEERLAVVEGALDVLRDAHEQGVVDLVQRGTPPGRRADDIVR